MPGEALPNAVPARLREYSAGRHAARAAMADLGAPPTPLPMGEDRAPLWPAGVTGSITHCRTACLAAVRRGPGGIGLDLEEATPLPPDLWDTVLLPPEADWARAQPDPGLAAKLVFSAKEAAYKAQYAESRALFGFDRLALTVTDTAFTARFTAATPPFAEGHILAGRWALAEGLILTAVAR